MWPNESANYREKRNVLLEKEAELRALSEEVALERRLLPPGGLLKEDYEFVRVKDHEQVRFSDLFAGQKNTLVTYSLMYRPGAAPCPMCVSLLDSLELAIPQLQRRINLAVFAKATPTQLLDLAHHRDWENLPLYSTAGNSFNTDYRAQDENGNQLPILHVWKREGDQIRHFWASELFFYSDDAWPHQPRHADSIWPLWNILDLTPEGRGEDWYPELD